LQRSLLVSTALEAGAEMEVRGEPWALIRAQPFESCTVLTLEGRGRSNARQRLRLIEPFDRPRAVRAPRLPRRRRHAVLRAALAAIASQRSADGLWTAAGASIDLWPYQLEPALAVIRGATRVLLADAVGLGKTIQAGLLLAELIERGWVERALVVCPAGLRDTWARELHDRFGLDAAIVDQASIAERITVFPPGINPWAGHPIAIASIDFVKRAEVLAALDQVPVDLLIADEAHHLAQGTDRGAAVSRLAGRAPWCVTLSATPHSGDAAAFNYLTAIGGNGDALAVFRRSRRDVGIEIRRRTHALPVRATMEEHALFAAADAYARAIWLARGTVDRAVRLVSVTIARRAASSILALERTLARRHELLLGGSAEPAQPVLPWDEHDTTDDVEADAVLGAPGLDNLMEERSRLERLMTLAGRCRASSKICRLMRLLRAIDEPALVFTEYRDTLEAIVARLPSSCRAAAIHGGIAADERRRAVDALNGGGIDVLIATDAAGEGLNLHHRCRLVIDFELPWSPVRLEQRAGRVDRIGQGRTVHAIRMFHPGTIESRVLDHLRLRGQSADAALDRCIADSDIAAAIFDDTPLDSTIIPAIRSDRIAAAAAEAARVAAQRDATRRFSATQSMRGWSPPKKGRPLLVLHRTTSRTVDGMTLDEHLEAHQVSLSRWPRDGREWRTAIASISATVRIRAIRAHGSRRRGARIEQRIAAIRSRLARQRVAEYQRSLFDGRADADAAERERVAACIEASLARVLRAVTAPAAKEAAHVELVAAWPRRRR
jgi:superfamily II DNA or RNA helicase